MANPFLAPKSYITFWARAACSSLLLGLAGGEGGGREEGGNNSEFIELLGHQSSA